MASANHNALHASGFPEFDGARPPVKRAQIQREKEKDAEDETGPVPGSDLNRIHLRFTIYDLRAQLQTDSSIANRQIANEIQAFAAVAFCIVTATRRCSGARLCATTAQTRWRCKMDE